MKSRKITDGDVADMKISALPTRPNAPRAFGGKGYTAAELKEAFDRLPLYIVERYNALIDDITADNGEGIATDIKTGISETHTLSQLFTDIIDGTFATYLTVAGKPLTEYILELKAKVDAIAK